MIIRLLPILLTVFTLMASAYSVEAKKGTNRELITVEEHSVLPSSVPGINHLGLAGAFSGYQNGAYIIAGGANFP
jgi:N-acetylneuraminic acid mutarotase